MFEGKDKLPFSFQTAYKLIAIAEDAHISKFAQGRSLLPPSWRTLYELTKLPDAVLAEKFKSGELNSETERGGGIVSSAVL